ncbi:hypothetical protein L9F63_007767, partial [Diploptera punctata]
EQYQPEQLIQHLQILCPTEKWKEEGVSNVRRDSENERDYDEEDDDDDDITKEFSFLPEEITYTNFTDDILGITSTPNTEENFKTPNV